ncbi:MAG TPA: sialidase family protein [Flavitalea sp.]|nr:sialidase family protein [Flavitalea sp.]
MVASGQMPDVAVDAKKSIHIAYGNGDSLMYIQSRDGGKTFSLPLLVEILPGLAASHTRGPQIAIASAGVCILACNSMGDIFSFRLNNSKWQKTGRVNDVDTVAKENLIALGGDGDHLAAAWLDLRGNKKNKIVGTHSEDGGVSWSRNEIWYASPDSTVCECCKPSVAVKGHDVFVMFRNFIDGNRDMYLLHSTDGGLSFGKASRLGEGNWQLDGCPMDGGAVVISNGVAQTVWRRQATVFSCTEGHEEVALGEGKGSTLEIVNGKTVYAWSENGKIILIDSKGTKRSIGSGMLPVIKSLGDDQIICIWEDDKKITSAVVDL